jgi:hypothetical protein
VLILASSIGYAMWMRAQQAGGASTEGHPTTNSPLPHQPPPADTGHVPTSPEALADARRVQQ